MLKTIIEGEAFIHDSPGRLLSGGPQEPGPIKIQKTTKWNRNFGRVILFAGIAALLYKQLSHTARLKEFVASNDVVVVEAVLANRTKALIVPPTIKETDEREWNTTRKNETMPPLREALSKSFSNDGAMDEVLVNHSAKALVASTKKEDKTRTTNEQAISESITVTMESNSNQPSNAAKQQTKKFYAVHIGPSKTATSTIQNDMILKPFNGFNTFAEDLDNVIYVGKRWTEGFRDPNSNRVIRTITTTVQEGNQTKNLTMSFTASVERRFYVETALRCMNPIMERSYKALQEQQQHNGVNMTADAVDRLLDTDEKARADLRRDLIQNCWKGKFEHMLDYNIVDSGEEYSYMSFDQTKLGRQFRIFDILGYERLVVVGAYRRYADWVVSTYRQKIKASCLENILRLGVFDFDPHNHECSSFGVYLDELLKNNRKDTKYNARWYENLHTTLPTIVSSSPSNLEVKILNYFQLPKRSSPSSATLEFHQNNNEGSGDNGTDTMVKSYDSITTELYCDALLMPHTCEFVRGRKVGVNTGAATNNTKNNATSSTSLVSNKSSQSDEMYHLIVRAAYRLGYLLPSGEALRKQNETAAERETNCQNPKKWCENLQRCLNDFLSDCKIATSERQREIDKITFNGTFSIVGTETDAILTWKDLSIIHQKSQQQRQQQLFAKNATKRSSISWTETLPIRCPPKTQLERLLERSLEFEALLMPKFSETSLGREEHRRLFWDVWLSQKKLFCWVDIERLFQNATSWNEILHDRMMRTDWEVSYDNEARYRFW